MASRSKLKSLSQPISWSLLGLSAVLAYGAMLVDHGRRLWTHDYFQFAPVYVIAVLWITIERIRISEPPPQGKWRIEPITLGASIAFMVAALRFQSPLAGALSFLLLGDSLLGGLAAARRSWRLLIVLIPLPLGLDSRLVQKLQQLSSAQASRILDAIDVPHLMQGNVLELANKRFFVEEACSGISSIYLMTAATALYVVLSNMRMVRSIPLLVSVLWWAIVANDLRIVTIAAAEYFHKIDLSSGWHHELLGVLLMLLALAGVWSTRCFLDFLLGPVRIEPPRSNQSITLSPAILWNAITSYDTSWLYSKNRIPFSLKVSRRKTLLTLTGLLAAFGAVYWGMVRPDALITRFSKESDAPTQTAAPQKTEAFDRLASDSFQNLDAAAFSGFRELAADAEGVIIFPSTAAKEWSLRITSGPATIIVDGPLDGWRNLEADYVNQGWKIKQTTVRPIPDQPDGNHLVTARLVKADGKQARLHFCVLRSSGELLNVPSRYGFGNVTAQIKDHIESSALPSHDRHLWQLRMVVEVTGHTLESEIENERRIFHSLLQELQRQWNSEQPPAEAQPKPHTPEGATEANSGPVSATLLLQPVRNFKLPVPPTVLTATASLLSKSNMRPVSHSGSPL